MGPRSLVMGEFLHLLINMWKLLKKLVETIETCEKHGTYNRGPLTELYHLYLCGNIWKLLKKYRAFELFLYIYIHKSFESAAQDSKVLLDSEAELAASLLYVHLTTKQHLQRL